MFTKHWTLDIFQLKGPLTRLQSCPTYLYTYQKALEELTILRKNNYISDGGLVNIGSGFF